MNTVDQEIAYYLERYRQGHAEDAFHGLLESYHAVLPRLESQFRASTDSSLRRFLLKVIWEHRQPSAIPLLGEALLDADPGIWREALNGLVALGSPASLAALRIARVQRDEEELRRWIDEAIEQAEEESQNP